MVATPSISASVNTNSTAITQLLTNVNNAHPALALSSDVSQHSINDMGMTTSEGHRWNTNPRLLNVKLFKKTACDRGPLQPFSQQPPEEDACRIHLQ